MKITSARPGLSWGGFSFAHVPMPSSSFPPLVWPPTVSRRHFCAHVQQSGTSPKSRTAVKAICRPYTAFFRLAVSLYSHATKHRTETRTEQHKAQINPGPLRQEQAGALYYMDASSASISARSAATLARIASVLRSCMICRTVSPSAYSKRWPYAVCAVPLQQAATII